MRARVITPWKDSTEKPVICHCVSRVVERRQEPLPCPTSPANVHLTRRGFSRLLGGCALGALVQGKGQAAEAQGQAPAQDFFFVLAADPQLFWGSVADWEKTVGHINRLKPAFAVVCGDMINRNGDAKKIKSEDDEKMARAYLEVAGKVDPSIPLHHVAGNHDVCNEPTPATLEWYQKRFGKLWYSFTHLGCRLIVLESDILKYPKDPLGLRIVKVGAKGVEHSYHAFDDLPASVTL